MPWPPISPSSFYNLPSGPPTSLCQLPMASGPHSPSLFTAPQINPSLMKASPPVGKSSPATPAAPSMDIQPPSNPSSKPVPHVSKHKIHEEFSGNDIDQLSRVVILVKPYLAPH